MPFIAVRDLNVYYEIHGDGPPLLFINGTGGDLRRRPSIFDSPLVASFTVLGYDQRGLGQTDIPDDPYTMADYAEDANALMDSLSWESCHVFGVSFGGMVAQELALRFPRRVQRLVLACTSSGGAGGASYPLHELANLGLTERTERTVLLSDTRRNDAWRAAHATEYRGLVEMAVAQRQIGADEPGREIGARRQLEARRQHDCYDRLPALTMPVYVCGGRHDGIAPGENQASLARQIPNAELELFEGGHLFLIEDRRAFRSAITFLRGEAQRDEGRSVAVK